jgi:ribonuclease P protein component
MIHGERLPRKLRIRRSATIRQILTKGQKYTGNLLILYCLASDDPNVMPQVAFLTPRRMGNAAKRNRVRRWMREVFRKHRKQMGASQQIILMGRTSAAAHGTYVALHEDFLRLARKARLLIPRDS